MDLLSFKKRFDPVLKRTVGALKKRAAKQAADPFIGSLIDQAANILLSGGKRVRPYLAAIMFETASGKRAAPITELFCALEIFHAFALVHDDIIDCGEMRHGVKTAHAFAESALRRRGRKGDAEHVGMSQALLVGDLLFSWAHELLSRETSGLSARAATDIRRVFHAMVEEVILGQMIDVDITTRSEVDATLIETKMKLKTAGYSFVKPLEFGAAAAGSLKKYSKFAQGFGEPLGIAFQIQDDLLDIRGTASGIKKSVLADIQSNQHTYFSQYIFERGTPAEKALLKRLMGKSLTKPEQRAARELFERSGALDHGRMLMEEYFDRAEEALGASAESVRSRRSFLDLLEYLRARVQ